MIAAERVGRKPRPGVLRRVVEIGRFRDERSRDRATPPSHSDAANAKQTRSLIAINPTSGAAAGHTSSEMSPRARMSLPVSADFSPSLDTNAPLDRANRRPTPALNSTEATSTRAAAKAGLALYVLPGPARRQQQVAVDGPIVPLLLRHDVAEVRTGDLAACVPEQRQQRRGVVSAFPLQWRAGWSDCLRPTRQGSVRSALAITPSSFRRDVIGRRGRLRLWGRWPRFARRRAVPLPERVLAPVHHRGGNPLVGTRACLPAGGGDQRDTGCARAGGTGRPGSLRGAGRAVPGPRSSAARRAQLPDGVRDSPQPLLLGGRRQRHQRLAARRVPSPRRASHAAMAL